VPGYGRKRASRACRQQHLLNLVEIIRKRERRMSLIEQHTETADRRKNIYGLTPKGHALVADITAALGG
jgi:DNA-binding MarR family transcriptional regulator